MEYSDIIEGEVTRSIPLGIPVHRWIALDPYIDPVMGSIHSWSLVWPLQWKRTWGPEAASCTSRLIEIVQHDTLPLTQFDVHETSLFELYLNTVRTSRTFASDTIRTWSLSIVSSVREYSENEDKRVSTCHQWATGNLRSVEVMGPLDMMMWCEKTFHFTVSYSLQFSSFRFFVL